MQESMTGFGEAQLKLETAQVHIEVKTLNAKFFDFIFKSNYPLILKKEIALKNTCLEQLKRGKVNLIITITPLSSQKSVDVDNELFLEYYNTYKKLAKKTNEEASSILNWIINSPGVITLSKQELIEEHLPIQKIMETLNTALEKCISFRKQEGQTLAKNILSHNTAIEEKLRKIHTMDNKRIFQIREKIEESLNKVIQDKGKIDQNRFEQELIYYLEKIDVQEEKERLEQHLHYFSDVTKQEKYAGKKLGFIAQEMGREINTIGSKINEATIQRYIVEMKTYLEKIKEQVLNLV